MSFSIALSSELIEQIKALWGLSSNVDVLEMTAFGDFFVQEGENYLLYSLTDARISDVSVEIKEYGLPPVSFELGDEWYQLDAQAALKEDGSSLGPNQCFGFVSSLSDGGEYSLDNISVMDILEYHRRASEAGLAQSS